VGGAGVALGATPRQAATTGLLLLPMAGLAIGLVNTTLSLFPEQGALVGAVVLAAVALLETVGPPIAARALRWSGDQLDEQAGAPVPPPADTAAADAPAPSAAAVDTAAAGTVPTQTSTGPAA
jgi:hypothetical protein